MSSQNVSLTARLTALLRAGCADLVGFGDISALSDTWTRCVSLAVALPASTICGIAEGPTQDYYEQYYALNAKLDILAETAASFLPHKTCATRSGLGWIGKSALLVTREFGPAVRLSSVLTDAPFESLGQPVNSSQCGGCTRCQEQCPGRAIQGALWNVKVEREALVDVEACRKAARALALERVGKEITLCGKCIEVCPYTQAWIEKGAC